ncbi:hypothetical protein QFC20_002753 [Naganishia adeliensis]|uniref:Uncharacterized protein n=1 Tax=Naganishia adeliensis TaxID=92952 RepID=A0ACC2WIR7_9TREE|nr:hypothetical protein QFC20_002753 [Naganishia adeliensis]
MSMMAAGAPPVAGQSFSMQAPRIPGAVLTNGLANPYIQHNSLASAGPVYPYNASVYSEQPYQREPGRIPTLSHEQSQRIGGYESGIYAYAGGMPDSLPRNSPSRFAQVRMSPAGMNPDGYMGALNPSRYPSTIYPDPPEMQRSEPTWRDAYDCEGCRDERLREDSERYAKEHIREGADGENTYRNKQNARPRRQAHRDHDEFDPQSPRPEDLRLDALRLHVVEPRGGNTNRSGRERHVSMPRNWVHANEGSGPESPASQRLSPHVAHRDSRIRSQSRDGHGRIGGTTAHHITPPDQRNLRPPQSLPHYLGSPIQEDMTEVFPLASRRNSPSRMHRHEYEGNQPAGFTTRSKLHPNFPK